MIKKTVKEYFHIVLYEKAYTRAIFTIFGLSWKELRMSFPQFFTWSDPFFSFLRSFKYALLALMRIPLGRSVRFSYAFTGEDRIIESLLKPLITKNGYYADVGCNDPRFISNTFLFYRRGWRGLCIDANEELIKKHRKIRPRDKAVCALISDIPGEFEFVELTNNVLSSADPVYLNEMKKTGQQVIQSRMMRSRTLTEIFDENKVPYNLDLLSLDIEELDLPALKSLDFEKYHPKLIVTEVEDFNPSDPVSHPLYSYLKEKGYTFKGCILTNLYFMKG